MALKVGIQLYSVRTEMEKDPIEAIRQVASIGYKNLEVANARADADPGVGFDVPADKLREILSGFGAHVVNGHIRPLDDTTAPAILAYHESIGSKYIGQSADFFTGYDQLMERCEYYNHMGALCAGHGMKFVYHNHYHEFQTIGGKRVLDLILENTDPETVCFEIDTFWVMRGGEDPVEVMKTVGSRLKFVHQKDFSKTSKTPVNLFESLRSKTELITRDTFGGAAQPEDFCEVGTGTMEIQNIIDTANDLGAEYIILEQDHTRLNPMESIQISMDSFRKYSGILWE